MTDEERKDKILSFLSENKKGHRIEVSPLTHFRTLFYEENIDDSDIELLCHKMKEDGYIDLRSGNVKWTFKGEAFIKNGGYAALKLSQQNQRERDKLINQLSQEKLEYDVKNAKRIYKTYWWTFGFAIAALGISLINLLYQLLK